MIQPRDITNEVKKRPPLQRETVERSYENIKVNWKLEFWNANKISTDVSKLAIHATPEKDIYPDISFEINKDEYPDLNILHQYDFLWVKGEISKVDGLSIFLKNATIKFKAGEEDIQPLDFGSGTFINSQLHFGKGDNIKAEKKNILPNAIIKNNILAENATLVKFQDSKKEKSGSNFFGKLTNNQTFAVVIGGLLLLVIIYLIFKYSGVNLSHIGQ
jgi:hypothetical protein